MWNWELGMAVQILRICTIKEIRKDYRDNFSFLIPH